MNQLPRSSKSLKRDADTSSDDEPSAKRPYYGKCQYKTGKCFNERTLKRNGDAHSLCEEHRVKQNLIQRRSDRKYQTVHAIRRRERSQRRAVLKKQVSMAVAQQLFFEHQQQKTLGIPLPQHHPLHLLSSNPNVSATPEGASNIVGLAPPIQPSTSAHRSSSQTVHVAGTDYESTPTGIDEFTPDSFLNIKVPSGTHSMPNLKDEEVEEGTDLSDNHGYMPIVSCVGDKETWSDDDIEFLQTILLA
ncbi:hypothetical protein JM18_002159 [Phytophthora kernoviae]|uniref:Uncharacterized protein n=2 Tax=Phytophthora kernoviae TaxID=325452 RepID=A0A8T0M5C6_9STRA|nr:hypothetical protein G195_002875 [Phytophthora kernoviae 00238/432]KAG2529547.1 hypothetical protein JM16_002054 [Phytophthora kernoviae]KAG2530466.1 hypothetical protein JM18_002159 [Phytophthora kernoviae]